VSISNSIEAGIHGAYAYWGLTQTWVDYFPVYFNVKVVVKKSMTMMDEDNILPKDFILYQNYPNPFNPSTSIIYSVPMQCRVTIKIFDILGKEVLTLRDEEKSIGNYSVKFDAGGLPSGIYFYQLKTDDIILTEKMILLR